jgi:glycosyltransferase involved in cell wall biosynthesis
MSSSTAKILLARTIWDHHAQHSGYDNVFRCMEGEEYVHVVHVIRQTPSFLQRVFDFLFSLIWRDFREEYGSTYLWFELRLIWTMRKQNIRLIHLTDAEKNYKYLPRFLLRSSIESIGTVHLPPSFYKAGWKQLDRLRFLDKMVVLDERSVRFFKQHFPEKIILYIPHAVDTSYFKPPQVARDDTILHCLTVGSFMRDLDTVQAIILQLDQDNITTIHFHIVYPWRRLHQVDGFRFTKMLQLEQVHAYNDLSDDDLLRLYQQCHVILLPLFDATANNSLLEGMACGMVPITNASTLYLPPSVSGIRTIEEVTSVINDYASDHRLYEVQSEKSVSITYARFSISTVLEQLQSCYE